MFRVSSSWVLWWLRKDKAITSNENGLRTASISQSSPSLFRPKDSLQAASSCSSHEFLSEFGSEISPEECLSEKKASLRSKKRKKKKKGLRHAESAITLEETPSTSLLSLTAKRTASIRNRQTFVGSFSNKNSRGGNAKKVAPPIVPEVAYPRNSASSFGSGSSSTASGYYTSTTLSDHRSSFGVDDLNTAPPSPSDVSLGKLSHKEMDSSQVRTLASPSRTGTGQIFTFPPTHQGLASLAKHDIGAPTTPPYGHQSSIEDQGIDMAQSPGRESPSSTTTTSSANRCVAPSGPNCRSSSTSLDSGRASYGNPGNQGNQPSNNRLSGHSYETSSSSSLRHSYHSSNSSLGSTGQEICRMNVAEMLAQGLPDHEVLNACLTEMGFEEYYDLFVQSGYDMHTIVKMTPEDLTAIGITKPNHRKRLKTEIGNLQIPDGLPDYVPDTLEEWLSLLGLAEYSPSLRRQGYRTVEDVSQLTWEDLEDFGILRLGHQKKITLAIKRVKDIMTGKWTPNMQENPILHTQFYQQRESPSSPYRGPNAFDQYYQQTNRQNCNSRTANHYAVPSQLPRPPYGPTTGSHPIYQPDIIAIQVHNTADGNSVERPQRHQSFYAPEDPRTSKQSQPNSHWRRRSYEEGDISPRQESVTLPSICEQYTSGTLPRQRGQVKVRPVAKIAATRTDSDPNMAETEACLKQLSLQSEYFEKQMSTEDIYDLKKLTPKKSAPLPPKRSPNSEDKNPIYARLPIKNYQINNAHTVQLSSLPLNGVGRLNDSDLPPPPDALLSDDSDDFPPPPAPMCASDSYIQQGQVAASVRERLESILQRSGAGHWPKITSPPGTGGKNIYGPSHLMRSKSRDHSPAPDHGEDVNTGEFRQRRNGSNDSFKSSSSTESESMPFANDNAGTIKQRSSRQHPTLSGITYVTQSPATPRRGLPPLRGTSVPGTPEKFDVPREDLGSTVDVLSDIGSMLAGLTNELDAMLEHEIQHSAGKR
ncbi:hypothetical protein QYM36_007694 [Artemia franciscana]|uniref:SAM domain-containing protein n=2 Tax=Artemia franciscana TaxID=6661 RepID=A0AA88IE22_ARTSF|nr:hypothetical protein QYM36_007694 [Artemia franciscana]KAK2726936.1 hypothetical protein QYM36_007694 [Artemia franciscana]